MKVGELLEICLMPRQLFMVIEQEFNGTSKILVENKNVVQLKKINSICERTLLCWQSPDNRVWLWVFPEGITTREELAKRSPIA